MAFVLGDIKRILIIIDEKNKKKISDLSRDNVEIARRDWDSYETSWDFSEHPLKSRRYLADGLIKSSFEKYYMDVNNQFEEIKHNEEVINDILIHSYGLENDIHSEVPEELVTITHLYDSKNDIPSAMQNGIYFLLCRLYFWALFSGYIRTCLCWWRMGFIQIYYLLSG